MILRGYFPTGKKYTNLTDFKFLQDTRTGSEENGFASKILVIWVLSEVRDFVPNSCIRQDATGQMLLT